MFEAFEYPLFFSSHIVDSETFRTFALKKGVLFNNAE